MQDQFAALHENPDLYVSLMIIPVFLLIIVCCFSVNVTINIRLVLCTLQLDCIVYYSVVCYLLCGTGTQAGCVMYDRGRQS